MPRYPASSPQAERIRGMTFAAFGARMAELAAAGELVPLHLGDTWRLPPVEARAAAGLDELSTHLYAPTPGLPALRAALCEREGVADDRLMITPGATGALSIATNVLFAPGEQVVVLTPVWPLIFGILQRGGVEPIELPAGEDGWPTADLPQRLEAAIGPTTTGVYICQPSNPVGYVLDPSTLDALADVARRHDLWIVMDEAYRELPFDGPLDSLVPRAPWDERAVHVRTFSKTYGLAGQRVGWLVSPPALRAALVKVGTHLIYHPSVPGQRMALGALADDGAFPAQARAEYRAAAEATCRALEGVVAHRMPDAGYYVWLDLRAHAETDDDALSLLGALLDQTGVALAPGAAFGRDFGRFARLCYTAVPPDALQAGLERIAAFFRAR